MMIIDLANAIKISQTNLINIENNKTISSLPTLRKLGKVLDVKISYLGCFENLPEETLGQRITKARCYMGLTKKELAEKMEVDVKTITNWEKDYFKPNKKLNESLKRFFKIVL